MADLSDFFSEIKDVEEVVLDDAGEAEVVETTKTTSKSKNGEKGKKKDATTKRRIDDVEASASPENDSQQKKKQRWSENDEIDLKEDSKKNRWSENEDIAGAQDKNDEKDSVKVKVKVAAHHAPLVFESESVPPPTNTTNQMGAMAALIHMQMAYPQPPMDHEWKSRYVAAGGEETTTNQIYPNYAYPYDYSQVQAQQQQEQESKSKKIKSKEAVRMIAGEKWVDPSLLEWPENDYRLFVGNLDKEARHEQLVNAFNKYPSYAMAKVVINKWDNKCKGYGFVSFLDPMDCAKALRLEQGKYCGLRPMQLKKSQWASRSLEGQQEKKKADKKRKKSLGLD